MNANAAATALACFVLLYSYQAGGIDYLYTERLDDIDSKMSSYHQYNAVCLAANTNNMTIAVPLLSGHVQSCYVPLEDAPQGVREMLEKSGSDSGPLVIYVPGIVHEKKIDESTIEAIAAFCGYKTYRQILSGKESGLQTVVYLLEP